MTTPIEFLQNDTQGNSIYVKRDDLFGAQRGFPLSGSKIRIGLKYLQDMQEKGCDALISYGSRYSNMNSSMAYLTYKNGIPCHIIEPVQDTAAHFSVNHGLAQDYGAIYHYCRPWDVRTMVRKVFSSIEKAGYKPYYIFGDEAGKGNRRCAVSAYEEAFSEIRNWERMQNWHFDYIFLPTGTGMTQAGLLAGQLKNDLYADTRQIIGVSISHSKSIATDDIRECLRQYFIEEKRRGQSEGTYPRCSDKDIIVLDEYRGGGYGIYDIDVCDMIDRINRTTQICLDPLYTGKAFYGMTQYLRSTCIEHGRILFLHTGGVPNYYDYQFMVQVLQERKRKILPVNGIAVSDEGEKAA